MTESATAGTGTTRPRVTHPHAYVPEPPEPDYRPRCRECHGEPGGDHLPTPRGGTR